MVRDRSLAAAWPLIPQVADVHSSDGGAVMTLRHWKRQFAGPPPQRASSASLPER